MVQPRFPDRLPGITAGDLQSFADGSHARLWHLLGARPSVEQSAPGVRFAVWAPNASRVSVIGDFNDWDHLACTMVQGDAGIWSAFVPEAAAGARYKFHVEVDDDFEADKSDPFALHAEVAPANASVVWDLDYSWGDAGWTGKRGKATALDAPVSIYEMHLGSWMRPAEPGRYLTYRELAPRLIEYLSRLRFTHVEFLPLMEHPLYASWGYQTTGYFAPTSRYGTPQDLKYLIDQLHQAGFAVILDWVPSHFPTDDHGLGYFDGTHLYEHEDPRQGFHPDWTSFIFNYGKGEVRSFLLSSAAFWLSEYHADALRVDGVSSMIYLDYSRGSGEWAPNRQGGRENTDATEFLRGFNERIYLDQPDAQTIAEESTDWPMVSRPTVNGGLGFGYKWDLGWMHDTLGYLKLDPALRKHHHNEITFRMLYAYTENFVLPLSHDEVVHGKGSLIGRMPGDEWQRFANLRLLYGYQYGQPGKKLLFMGAELAQTREWRHDHPLDWELLEQARNAGVSQWVTDLNRLYRDEPALHAGDCDPSGFEWIAADDREASVVSHLRKAPSGEGTFLLVYNFTPVPRHDYRIGVPSGGTWREMANSDSEYYGGSGLGNLGVVEAQEVRAHGRPWSLDLTLPPLACLFLKSTG